MDDLLQVPLKAKSRVETLNPNHSIGLAVPDTSRTYSVSYPSGWFYKETRLGENRGPREVKDNRRTQRLMFEVL